jgi:hypothetical protein
MNNSNTDIDIIDFIDLLNHTLSRQFIELWKYKYSEKFIKQFQIKILQSLSNQKPLKIDTLFTYLTKKCKYSQEQVLNFFEAIDIRSYYPFIVGKLTKHKK